MTERKRRRKRDGIRGTTRHLPHLTLFWPAPTQRAFTVPTLLQKMLVAALFEAASSLAGKEMVTSRLSNAAASRTPAPTASSVNSHARRPLLRVPASLLLAAGPWARREQPTMTMQRSLRMSGKYV